MNAHVASTHSPVPVARHRAKAPWILAVLSPFAFVVLMETFEGITMSGSSPDIPDAIGLPIFFALVALLPATAVALGIRAIRRGDRGKPWIPTIVSVLFVIQLAVMVVAAIVVG